MATLPGLTFCQTNENSSGTGELTCLLDSAGTAYMTWKEYPECLMGGSGWRAVGLQGLCVESAEWLPDSACKSFAGGSSDGPPNELGGTLCRDM